MNKDAEFLKKLLATFKVEAQEHLQGISSGLIEMEKESSEERQAEIIETVFREAHSLKGAARAVNLPEIESLCQAMESVFSALKKKEAKPGTGLFDLLQEGVDFLGRILSAPGAQRTQEDKTLQAEFVRRLAGAVKTGETGKQGALEKGERIKGGNTPEIAEMMKAGEVPRPVPEPESFTPETSPPVPDPRAPIPILSETVRVSTTKLSSVLLQSEEMLSAKLAAGQRALDMKAANASFGVWKKEWAKILPIVQEVRPAVKIATNNGMNHGNGTKQRSLAKLLDFLDWNSNFIKSLEGRYVVEAKSAERDNRALGGMVNNLLDDMKKVLMFPFSSLLEILPKIVRDLARDSGKEVGLSLQGDEIEIDRRILEEMKDPLVHLIRNCIDHGIERPDERVRKNKPRQGTITVTIAPRDNKVELVVGDDGVGINLVDVRAAVHKAGTLPGEKIDELADTELLKYVFQSGVSTSPIITELSGRGLGLAIVREKVEKLGGSVSLETAADTGSRFRIVLPLTVATFRGITVRVGERLFVLPTMHVERSVRLRREEIIPVENRETIRLDGEAVSLARLTDVLGLPRSRTGEATDMVQGVVLTASGTRIAFLVDEVLGEQEVLLKGLGRQLSRVRNVAGATVLGTGRVVPIINIPDLLKSAVKVSAPSVAPAETGTGESQKRSILVVEDSITTRTLLKNILEGAGYAVVTAVDGVDAFTRLKSETFDIVVSDVDMPRMDGFDLTAKIRNDKVLGNLPVVLVTALASGEDRERGIDVGANAYIVKGSFEQSNLLEVLGRLI